MEKILTGLGRLRIGLVLGCVGALFCALAASARGDEIQYLPNNPHVIMSLDVPAFLNSKTLQELKKLVPEIGNQAEKNIGEELGIPLTNISRVSKGAVAPEKKALEEGGDISIAIVTTAKPVTAAEIKAMKKAGKFQTNVNYKEVKVGTFTIYQQTYQFATKDPNDKPGKVIEGTAFCVAEDKVVLVGPLPSLKNVLERNKKPDLSANMQAGLKAVGSTNMAMVVLDIENLPAWARENMMRGLGELAPAANGADGKLKFLTVTGNDTGSAKGTATLVCKDAAGAAEVKKAVDAVLVALKGKLVADPKLPAQAQEMIKGARQFLDAAKLTVQGDTITGTVAVESATMANFLAAVFMPMPSKKQPKDIGKDSK